MSVADAVTLIGAVTAAVVSVMTVYMQLRAGEKIEATHALVNGQSQLVSSLAVQVGLKTGELVGRDYIPPATEKT
jgi:hypothetical protein